MEAVIVKAGQFLLSLAILIVLHEFGHFIFAKIFKTRVEKFYLFFNPWFSIFKKKIGETEYGLGWVPLGGYVKISGMIDESMDKEQLSKPPEPYEMRSKPAWQRLFIMLGGVLVNFILAIVIYVFVLYTWGEKYIPMENVKHGVYFDSLAIDMGFQNGDQILSIDGQQPEKFSEFTKILLLDETHNVEVRRNGEVENITLPENYVNELIKLRRQFARPALLPIVDTVLSEHPAVEAGLKKGDEIYSINGIKTPYYGDVTKILQNQHDQTLNIKVQRGDSIVSLNPTKLNDKGMLGFGPVQDIDYETQYFGFLQSIPAGIDKGVSNLVEYIKQFRLIFNPETEAYKSLGGFLTIGDIFPSVWNWEAFWNLTAFLSVILAFMNILPIPALDGGHVMFLLYEMVTGHKPSDKFMEYAQIAGMVILFALLIFANGNDIVRYFF